MLNSFLYPGLGQKLNKVGGANGNVVDIPNNGVIPNGGYSESIAAHDAMEVMFSFQLANASALSADIEISQTADFVNSDVLATVAFTGRTANWSAGKFLTGFLRVKNASGQNMTVYCQKRIR